MAGDGDGEAVSDEKITIQPIFLNGRYMTFTLRMVGGPVVSGKIEAWIDVDGEVGSNWKEPSETLVRALRKRDAVPVEFTEGIANPPARRK